MSSYKDAKAMAKSLRSSLAVRNVSLSHSECLEIVSRQFGFTDWNTLSSKLENEDRRPSPIKDSPPHPPPASTECKYFPDDRMPAIAITGDLKIMPVYVVDWRPGVLSDPVDLTGNGTYRIELTPIEPRKQMRHWITCRTCGSPGSILSVALADAHGRRLGSVNLVTAAHTPGIAIFGRYGVMVESVPRDSTYGPLFSTFSSRNTSAGIINRG